MKVWILAAAMAQQQRRPILVRNRPYKSLADAKLARSSISGCPNRSLTVD